MMKNYNLKIKNLMIMWAQLIIKNSLIRSSSSYSSFFISFKSLLVRTLVPSKACLQTIPWKTKRGIRRGSLSGTMNSLSLGSPFASCSCFLAPSSTSHFFSIMITFFSFYFIIKWESKDRESDVDESVSVSQQEAEERKPWRISALPCHVLSYHGPLL